VSDEPVEIKLITRALDNALDIFGPIAKEAILSVMHNELSLSTGKNREEQIENFMIQTVGNTAGKMLSNRFMRELKLMRSNM
jgi:hypothetical protein